MKLKASTSRKLRYGGVTAIFTAAILAVVIIVNVIFSALAQKFLWYTDLTPEKLFTVSDNFFDLMRDGDPEFTESTSPIEKVNEIRAEKKAADASFQDSDLMIKIIFCDDRDAWDKDNTMAQYVYYTARQIEEEFSDHVDLEFVNIVHNPTRLTKYGAYSRGNVIIEFGTEYRLLSIEDFFVSSDEESDPWAYNGEKMFASAIMAVTRAESPVACLTVDHGETLPENSTRLLRALEAAGFTVQALNLKTEPIPQNCRLMIVFNPTQDFIDKDDAYAEVDEIDKLETYLDQGNSLMVFMSPDSLGTKRLHNFEDYLEEWGIVYDRKEEVYATPSNQIETLYHASKVVDHSQSLSSDGLVIKAEYVTEGFGGSVTTSMQENGAPMIVFPNAMSISYSELFTRTPYQAENSSEALYYYGQSNNPAVNRQIYDVFVTSENAIAQANGESIAKATDVNPLKLMTVSTEDRTITENYATGSTINKTSYVFACGSTDFANESILQQQSYGNNAFLEYALRVIGQEPVPVGLDLNVLYDDTIDTITTAEATRYTVILTVIPAILAIGCGIVVIVRRKYR